ncbi:MAG TPA: FAD-dependent oxidoreductase [Candidatus Bilamarchaeum sp.]|nr:FAD-dependent oxidoreductase [Candidatus Bilamarchaeum sp.]
MEELIIIGSGPAGLSAALYAEKHGVSFRLLSRDPGWIGELTEDAEITPPSRFMSGYDLLRSLGSEVTKRGIAPEKGDVSRISRAGDSVTIETETGNRLARAALVATGRSLRRLGVKGDAELEGKGVSYWPQLDAEKYRGRTVAVVCGPETDGRTVAAIGKLASKTYVIGDVRGVSGVERLPGEVKEILGKSTVHGIVAGDETLDVEAVFVLLGFRPNSGMLAGSVETNGRGEIVIGKDNMTSMPGVFAAGDVTDVREKQILVALGEGVKAANSAITYISSHAEPGHEAL